MIWLFCVLLGLKVNAEDIPGCGGFLKVSPLFDKDFKESIDFTSFKVSLFRKDGTNVYSTNCAPSGIPFCYHRPFIIFPYLFRFNYH